MHTFELQPLLENELVKVYPLKKDDFEILFSIASDPLIWEQHPNKDRYKREVFEVFFEGAIKSGGAFLVYSAKKGKPIGCSRYYDYNPINKTVMIGYTFFARECWGTGYNKALKLLMLEHAFGFVEHVYFHIGAFNIRSQKAIKNIGAKKINEVEIEYYGEGKKLNFVYEINLETWGEIKAKSKKP